MTFSPEAAANLAKGYELAAHKLLDGLKLTGKTTVKSGFVLPAIIGPVCGAAVLAALSIEIGLKGLLKKHTGRTLRTHDHVQLFSALPTHVRSSVEQRYKKATEAKNKNSGGSESVELREVLSKTKDAFNTWRYIHEPTELPRHIDFGSAATAARILADAYDAI